MSQNGRPEYTDEQYKAWLGLMEPYLKQGFSVYRAMTKANLLRYKDSIYRKFRLDDWFCEKIQSFQLYIGDLVVSSTAMMIKRINEKLCRGESLTKEEVRVLIFSATHMRSCRPYFIQANEKHPLYFDATGREIAPPFKELDLSSLPIFQEPDTEYTIPSGEKISSMF